MRNRKCPAIFIGQRIRCWPPSWDDSPKPAMNHHHEIGKTIAGHLLSKKTNFSDKTTEPIYAQSVLPKYKLLASLFLCTDSIPIKCFYIHNLLETYLLAVFLKHPYLGKWNARLCSEHALDTKNIFFENGSPISVEIFTHPALPSLGL